MIENGYGQSGHATLFWLGVVRIEHDQLVHEILKSAVS